MSNEFFDYFDHEDPDGDTCEKAGFGLTCTYKEFCTKDIDYEGFKDYLALPILSLAIYFFTTIPLLYNIYFFLIKQ